jgi:hypothetical protein
VGRPRWSSRLTVEQCLPLTVESFHRSRTWDCTSGSIGTASWASPDGLPLGKIEYAVRTDAGGLAIRIRRQYTRLCGELRLLEESLIRITTTRPHLGGKRHWFLCPVVRQGKPCNRRVGRLYLTPGAAVFGCRGCHDLTYTTAREHDQRKYDLARDPLALITALDSEKRSRAFLGVQAIGLFMARRKRRRTSRD